MAKQIAGVYESIMECAKAEFLVKGYVDASLREIARAAGTSTGSIYTRFGDKEGLFEALVEPVSQGMKEMFLQTQKRFQLLDRDEQTNTMSEYTKKGMDQILDYMYDHYDEFRLLLDSSYGTKFHNFIEDLVDIEVEYTYKYMDTIECTTEYSGEIMENFLHIATNGYFTAMFEVIRHGMKREDATGYVKMLQKYHFAGFDTIFYPDKYK